MVADGGAGSRAAAVGTAMTGHVPVAAPAMAGEAAAEEGETGGRRCRQWMGSFARK